MNERAYGQEKSVWDSRLSKAGVVLVAAGFAMSFFRIGNAAEVASLGVELFLAGLSWNWVFGKKR